MQLDERLKTIAEAGLETTITDATVIGGGRNSQVFRITTSRGSLVLKHYIDLYRLQAESAAFQFLQGQGVTSVPEVHFIDEEHQIAIYTFIEGDVVRTANLTTQDFRDCVTFVEDLKRVGQTEEAAGFGNAAEGFFQLLQIEENIRLRLERLEKSAKDSPLESELNIFLRKEFRPAYKRIRLDARSMYGTMRLPIDQNISKEERILSPSDFGFHNATRGRDGMVFYDFEYFGWDDPAKLISDFLLHPGMDIPQEARVGFARAVIETMEDPLLPHRLDALLPLFGLKWCMILLNEFLRTDYERRQFAGESKDRRIVLEQQLDKACAMLKTAQHYADNYFSVDNS